MRKIGLLFIGILIAFSVSSQDSISKLDYKLGVCTAFMGIGDAPVMGFENEINYKINNYISTSLNIGIGRSINNNINNNDYLQAGLNIFISPFRNNNKNNFKIGLGYTIINETRVYSSSSTNDINSQYNFLSRTSNAFTIIIEDEYMISQKFLIGAKLFSTNGIQEGGIISGAMLKFGILI